MTSWEVAFFSCTQGEGVVVSWCARGWVEVYVLEAGGRGEVSLHVVDQIFKTTSLDILNDRSHTVHLHLDLHTLLLLTV